MSYLEKLIANNDRLHKYYLQKWNVWECLIILFFVHYFKHNYYQKCYWRLWLLKICLSLYFGCLFFFFTFIFGVYCLDYWRSYLFSWRSYFFIASSNFMELHHVFAVFLHLLRHCVQYHGLLTVIITNIQARSNCPLENAQAAGRWRTSRGINTFAALLIIEMLMNCIFNQINGALHNYLTLYIGDNVGSLFICGPCTCSNICTLAPLGRKCYYAGHK